MTKEERSLIVDLQKQGFGYRTIAAKLGLNLHSVKSYCARHPINKNQKYCLQCGVPVEKLPHKKEKKFCSDKCRFAWWREHKDEMTRRSVTKLFCPVCGQSFEAYESSGRKYCSRACYGKAKTKGVMANG